MIIEGKFAVKAPIQKLWDTLMKPETLRECIPGAEKIELIDRDTYDCVVKQKVGPIAVRFKFKNKLVNIQPLSHVEMEGEGEDIGKAGRFMQRTSIDLEEKEGGEVEIAYSCKANIVGKLAMFGDRIMRAKAKKVEAEFKEALSQKLKNLE
jgi:carbon monoxide dehydrogenase subunit G